MPKVGRTFTAKGGTIFVWDPTDAETMIKVIVPVKGDLSNRAREITQDVLHGKLIADFPGADLNEFVAHIIGSAVAESVVLLFPSLHSGRLQVQPAPGDPPPDPPKDAA